jgi:murein DD-endopeptidase MepM/ murein hydrolase activator NlpD
VESVTHSIGVEVQPEYREGDLAQGEWDQQEIWQQSEEEWEQPQEALSDPVADAILAEDGDLQEIHEPEMAAPSAPEPPVLQAPQAPTIQAATSSRGTLQYRVQRGDTLFGIAKRFEIPVAQLILSNQGLEDVHHLRPGMNLSLKPAQSLKHQVDAGESLWSIANLYGITVGELIAANSIHQQRIFVNQELQIPTGGFTSEQFETAMRRQKNRGKTFLIPVNGRKTDHFGMRNHPILARRILHGGLDIAARRGTPIRASQKGVVTFAGKLGGYGCLIEIRHASGFTTRYGHCDRLLKKKGDRVSRGDSVALTGMTGLATAPHVHFEIRKNGVPQDPVKYL